MIGPSCGRSVTALYQLVGKYIKTIHSIKLEYLFDFRFPRLTMIKEKK